MTERGPAFYAATGRAGEWWTLLHPPYTAWHLSYVAIGAAIAPTFDAQRLVAFELQAGQGFFTAEQRHAAAGHDALFQGRLRRALGVFDEELAFLHFGLGRGADVDLRHAAGQLRQPLLQLLAVVVAVGVLDFLANLLGPAVDFLLLACAADHRRFFRRDAELLGAAKIGKLVGAKYMVMGNFIDFYGKFRVDARIVNVETSEIVKVVTNDPKLQKREELFKIIQSVSEKLMAETKLPPLPS